MAKPWKELKAKYFNAEELAEIEAETQRMIAEMPLNELRTARQISQAQLAEILGIKQPTVAKLERRADMYVSTLRNVVRAMGGELEIIAHFPEGEVRINQFRGIGETEGEAQAPAPVLAETAAEVVETYRPAPTAKRSRRKSKAD